MIKYGQTANQRKGGLGLLWVGGWKNLWKGDYDMYSEEQLLSRFFYSDKAHSPLPDMWKEKLMSCF